MILSFSFHPHNVDRKRSTNGENVHENGPAGKRPLGKDQF